MSQKRKNPQDWDRTRAAANCREKLSERMRFLSLFLSELIDQDTYGFKEERKRQRTREFLEMLLGGPRQFGLLQMELNAETCGILERLQKELPNLSDREVLIFSYSAFGFSNRIISVILDIPNENYVGTLRSRLRKRIERLDSPYKEEYLTFIPRNYCPIGQEMLYLHNL